MNYLISLTNEEIKYICTVIPFEESSTYFKSYPKEFNKLRPGFRVKSLNGDAIIRILYDFRNRDFIATFLNKHIERWIKEINEEIEKALENGLDQEAAYIDVLSRSFFFGNVELFFKIIGVEKSEEYLKIMRAAVFYQSDYRKKDKDEIDFLKKSQRELIGVQEDLRNRISDEGKKLEKLKKEGKELEDKIKDKNEQLVEKQEKNADLLKKVDRMEAELKKIKDNEIQKISEMQQKMEDLSFKLNSEMEKAANYETSISEYVSKLSAAENDVETWKNKVRSCEKQLFSLKTERAAILIEQESDKRQIKELRETLETRENIINVIETKKHATTDRKMPLCPEDMDDFGEYFVYNLENIGFDNSTEGFSDFVEYFEKSIFRGVPLLIKRGPGINLGNCLANTIYGAPVAAHLLYSEGLGVQNINEFLAETSDRVVCIDGFIGNCNEMELIPVLEQHRNKIIILTYMYDRTLSFVPYEILSSVYFISVDVFASILRIKDVTEDPSEVKEIPAVYKSNIGYDSRLQRIAYDIACECGIGEDTARAMTNMIEDENYLNEMLIFTLLPYVSKVLEKNPYNCSKRLQRYAGEAGRCLKKDIMMRWFG